MGENLNFSLPEYDAIIISEESQIAWIKGYTLVHIIN